MSKHRTKKRGPKFKKRGTVSREQLFPKKVLKEQLMWDLEFLRMQQAVEAAFPHVPERVTYLRNLLQGLENESAPNRPIK